jgi:arylsulfatase A-like enzyme
MQTMAYFHRNRSIQFLKKAGILWLLGTAIALAQKKSPPNIVILLADDLGYGDLSHTGGLTPTPHIDKLFEQGIEFTNFMTNPVCTPTRGGMLTGLHPLRIGAGPETGGNLDPNLPNMGNFFQKEGYLTGLFGKWHNSPSPNQVAKAPTVNQFGFDRFVGFYAGAVDYFSKASTGWFHDGQLKNEEQEYATDLTAKYAIEFMNQANVNHRPFLCYIPFPAVHGPHVVKEALLKRVPEIILSKVKDQKPYDFYRKAVINIPEWRKFNATLYNDPDWLTKAEKLSKAEIDMLYSAMVTSLDDNVGLIMDYLKNSGLMENTIILFFSDNGGTEYAGNNAPFRGAKHSLYEGGIHAPATMLLPKGTITNNPKKVTELCGYLDIFPTLADLAKSQQKLPKNLDGISMVKRLEGTQKKNNRSFYWNWRDHDVLRTPQWKLFRYYDKVEVYNMTNDLAETQNVADANPKVVQQLLKEIALASKKTGVATMHLPLTMKATAANSVQNTLAVTLNFTTDLKQQTLKILKKEVPILADYYLEYDIKVASPSLLSYCYFSPLRGNNSVFNDKNGINLNNKPLQSPTIWEGEWKHVAVGLGSLSPLTISDFGLTFKANAAGETTIYLDNIHIKNGKGKIICKLFEEEEMVTNARIVRSK